MRGPAPSFRCGGAGGQNLAKSVNGRPCVAINFIVLSHAAVAAAAETVFLEVVCVCARMRDL